ncbi:collagen-like protein, partial [Lactiplantibacillus plantarum]|nr:collagen-like protein [Lactiplantibacillus plantarum]
MTKTLEFAYETPQEVKVGDDETTFTLVCKNEDLPVDLTTAKLITVKIGNRSGYLRGQLISIDSLAKLPTGQLKFSFDKDTLANFPTGSYCLEVWVTDTQGTSIYPSGNPLNFIVTANIENSSGANITTVAYDDFVEAMNKS